MTKNDINDSVLVFVPSYNDAKSLDEIVGSISDLGERYRCLLVDDGSDPPLDLTAYGSKNLVCRLPDNIGIGFSTSVALQHASRFGYAMVVRVDADGQHPIKRIPDLLQPIENGTADIVAGVRANRNRYGNLPFLRSLIRKYFSLIVFFLTKGNCPSDVNTGFMALSSAAVVKLRDQEFSRFPEPELFVLASSKRLVVTQIEVEQEEREHGASTLTVFAAARMIVRFTIYAVDQLLRRLG